MFITASATKGTMRNEEKRIKDKAVAGHSLLLLNEGFEKRKVRHNFEILYTVYNYEPLDFYSLFGEGSSPMTSWG